MFSLSYRNRRLMFYSSDVANFLNERFGVNLSYSGSTSSRTPLESLRAEMHCLICMVLSFPICKTGMTIFPASESEGYNDYLYYWCEQWVFVELWKNINSTPHNAKGILPSWYWSWTILPSLFHYTPQTYTHKSSLKLVKNVLEDSKCSGSQSLYEYQCSD